MNVVCLNWNDYLGRGAEYVSKLRNMVARNLTLPYTFEVVTEEDLPFQRDSWWNKLTLFDMFHDETLYLDLDVVITANINHLVERARTDRDRVWMRDDFSYSIVKPRQDLDEDFKRFLGGAGCCNSSVMLWNGVYHFERDPECHGDQNVITRELWPDHVGLLPYASIKSYKYHPGEVAPIVVFHGEPKPHEVRDHFVQDHWR